MTLHNIIMTFFNKQKFVAIHGLPDYCFFCAPGSTPYKGLMETGGQPGFVFRYFCLKQDIDFIMFCLNQGIEFIIFFVLNRVSFLGR